MSALDQSEYLAGLMDGRTEKRYRGKQGFMSRENSSLKEKLQCWYSWLVSLNTVLKASGG
jgi:hypothetical protein